VYVSKGTDGVWRFEGHGTLGGVFKGWLGLQIRDEELDEMNAMADEMNATAVLESSEALRAEGVDSTFGPQTVESGEPEPASAQVHNRWCPRRDSNSLGPSLCLSPFMAG
jgi:hypothetical protein